MNDHKPIVEFNKRIGSESKYGVAWLNMGKGFAKLFRFSSKIMSSDLQQHKNEAEILEKTSQLVESNKCPNMPITYKIMNCDSLCKFQDCPNVAKQNKYFVVLNELADYDLQTWFKEKHDDATYESVIMQMIFAIYAFHNLGYEHNDAHLGNFLVHKIKPGGYWRYKIKDTTVYVPNKGYLIVLWDFGISTKLSKTWTDDYIRFLTLLYSMNQHKLYKEMKLKPLSLNIRENCLMPMLNLINYNYKEEPELILEILENIENNIIEFDHIKINSKAPDYLLNIKPYTC